jgi:integrase
MATEKLSVKKVEDAKPRSTPNGPQAAIYGDGGGLYLRVGPTGAKSWVYRYMLNGNVHTIGLGPTHTFSLAEARDKALIYRKIKYSGVDPLAEKRKVEAAAVAKAASAKTFAEVADEWFATHKVKWSPKHRANILASLQTHVYPVIGDMPVADVDQAAILRCIRPKWLTTTKAMDLARNRIENVIGFAMTAGYRPTGDNPATWKGRLDNILADKAKVAKVVKQPWLDYRELPACIERLRAYEGPRAMAAKALLFTILTAARTGEVVGATWQEIDVERRLWTIPAERMKAEQEHVVPLSEAALAILQALPRHGAHVFSGLADRDMLRLLQTFKLVDPKGLSITVHGMRATFKTWADETTAFAPDTVETALAHSVGGAVERAYNRGQRVDQRRLLMDAWANYCDGVEPTVVELRRA